jgi:hypothetical protein
MFRSAPCTMSLIEDLLDKVEGQLTSVKYPQVWSARGSDGDVTLWPCDVITSTCRSLATISSGLQIFLGIAVLLRAKTIAHGGPLHGGAITDTCSRHVPGLQDAIAAQRQIIGARSSPERGRRFLLSRQCVCEPPIQSIAPEKTDRL